MKFNEEAFKASAKITAAVAEEAELEMKKESADEIADFFAVLYKRLSLIAGGKDPDSCKPGKFELYRDSKGQYRFRLKACNGEIIAVSEGYEKKDSCIKGIKSVINSSEDAEIKEL